MEKQYIFESFEKHWKGYLFFGLCAYCFLGIGHQLITEKKGILPYYLGASAFTYIIAFFVGKHLEKVNDSFLLGKVFSIVSTFLTINLTYLVFSEPDHHLSIYLTLIVGLGLMHLSWLMPNRLAAYNYFIALAPTIYFTITLESSKHLYLLIPPAALVIWVLFSTLMQRIAVRKQIAHHKMHAYQATVISLNHEFRNSITIINGLLNTECEENEEHLILTKNLKTLISLIDKVSTLEEYKETDYAGSKRMVDLGPRPNHK